MPQYAAEFAPARPPEKPTTPITMDYKCGGCRTTITWKTHDKSKCARRLAACGLSFKSGFLSHSCSNCSLPKSEHYAGPDKICPLCCLCAVDQGWKDFEVFGCFQCRTRQSLLKSPQQGNQAKHASDGEHFPQCLPISRSFAA